MADTDPSDAPDRTYNAGQAAVPDNLELTRSDAQARANVVKVAVRIYRHVGGLQPKAGGKGGMRRVPPNGQFMWREVQDGEGRDFPPPRFWEAVETITPQSVQ